MPKAIQMTINPSLSESKTKPSTLKSKSPTTKSSAIKPPTGCSKVYYFLLRVLHFCIENSFLLVALVAFVPLPLDVTKALDFGEDKFTTVRQKPYLDGVDNNGDPAYSSPEILFGFVPRKLQKVENGVRSICLPSIYGYQKGYTYKNQKNQNIIYNEDGTLDVTLDVQDVTGYDTCTSYGSHFRCDIESFTSLATFRNKYDIECGQVKDETVCLDSACWWGGGSSQTEYCSSISSSLGSYYKTLTLINAPSGSGSMNCDECNAKDYDSCIVPELERKNENSIFEKSTSILLNYTGSEFFNGHQGLRCSNNGVELSYRCADREVSDVKLDFVPVFLTSMNIGFGFIGFLILLDGFVQNLRNPFGSFRYYQQALQFKRRKLLQGYLVLFALLVVGYAIAMVFVVILPSMGHIKDGNGVYNTNDRLFDNAVSFKVLLMFAACLTGLLKGFDFDEDYYLISEKRATNKEGCCGRGCGCCFIGGSTHAKEFVDDVLLFDSVLDLIGPSDHNIFLIESAVGGYWNTGRNETLLMLLRGKDNVQNVELLCRKGGAIERRMIAECDAAEKSMNVGKSDGKKMDTTVNKPAVGIGV